MSDGFISRKLLVILAITVEGGLGMTAFLAGWLLDVPFWETIVWTEWDAAGGVLACVPMLLMLAGCLLWPWEPLVSIKRLSAEVVRPLFRPCSLLELALISIVAGASEEGLFRGLFQPLLAPVVGPALAVVLTAILFGAMHPLTLSYAVLATLIGAYLGFIYLTGGNLLTVIIAHALYDFVALAILCRAPLRLLTGAASSPPTPPSA